MPKLIPAAADRDLVRLEARTERPHLSTTTALLANAAVTVAREKRRKLQEEMGRTKHHSKRGLGLGFKQASLQPAGGSGSSGSGNRVDETCSTVIDEEVSIFVADPPTHPPPGP